MDIADPTGSSKTKMACQSCHILDLNNWAFISPYQSVIGCGPQQSRVTLDEQLSANKTIPEGNYTGGHLSAFPETGPTHPSLKEYVP